MSKRFTCLILTLCMALSIAACSKEEVEETTTTEATTTTTEATTTTTTEETTTTTTEPEDPLYDPNIDFAVNPVTGVQDMATENEGKRSVAVVINNIKAALPARGVSEADLIYEYVTEGGITRLLCVFADIGNAPELGSLRSARIVACDLANGTNSIFIHFGREPRAVSYLASNKIDHLDGNNMSGGKYSSSDYDDGYVKLASGIFFWRDKAWSKVRSSEHTAVSDGTHIKEAIEYKNISLDGECPRFFNFVPDSSKDLENGEDCTYAKVKISGYMKNAIFEYNEEDGLYYKSEYGDPQIDENNDEQVAVTNVFVLYCRVTLASDDYRTDYHFDEGGDGYYISAGKKINVTWTKETTSDQIKVFNEAGEEVEVNRGKSYVCLCEKSYKDDISFEK